MKSFIKKLLLTIMLATGIVASASDDIQIYTADNSKGEITPATIEKAFEDAGFLISANKDLNIAFNAKYQKTHHKLYWLFQSYKADLVLELVKITPKAALFAPLSMSIYMDKGSNDISVSSLSIDGMAKITGIPANNKHMIIYAKLVRDTLAKALPNGNFEKIKNKISKPEGELIISFSFEMEETEAEAIAEELEGIQTELEGSLEMVGFVIAGFNQLGDEFKDAGYDKYDFFDAYSICKIPVIYPVSKVHPEAGAFAPCTLYMYKEKGSLVVHMAYPSVYNWLSSLGMQDKEAIDALLDAQKKMIEMINETIE